MLKSRLILYTVLLAGALVLLKMNLSPTDKDKTPASGTNSPAAPTAEAATPAQEKEQSSRKTTLLSSHMTIARFDGLKDHQCRGLTTLCPDKCGDSGKLAAFTITKYLKYTKPGEYGDPEQKNFMIMYENTLGKSQLTPEEKELVTTLKPGDPVLLCWNHNYVTDEATGSSYPERPITVLKKLTPEEAAKEIQNGQG